VNAAPKPDKSNVREVAALARPYVHRGDLVVSTHPEQTPALRFYLGTGFRWATTLGPVRDPQIMDWRDVVDRIRAALPEMPSDRRARFTAEYGLSDYDARVLVSDRALAGWFEAAAKTAPAQAKRVANWVTGELLGHLNASGAALDSLQLTPAQLGALVGLIEAGTISTTAAKTVFADMLATGRDADAIVAEKGLSQVSDEAAIAAAVDAAIAANPKAVADVRAGNSRALAALFGPVMKALGGKANPAVVNKLIAERIK